MVRAMWKGVTMNDGNDDNPERNEDARSEDNLPNKNIAQVPAADKKTEKFIKSVVTSYFPSAAAPLNRPAIDDDFQNLPTIERVTESIKYNILCLEYAISPKGGLRQWFKLNISLLLLFGIPILIFVPLATYFMQGFTDMSELFANATQFLLSSALNILKLFGVLIAISIIIWGIFKLMALRFGQRNSKSDDYIDVTPNKAQ